MATYDDSDTRTIGEAYELICEMLEPNEVLRKEIAAAVLEAATYGPLDKTRMVQAAIDLIYIDNIETEFA